MKVKMKAQIESVTQMKAEIAELEKNEYLEQLFYHLDWIWFEIFRECFFNIFLFQLSINKRM